MLLAAIEYERSGAALVVVILTGLFFKYFLKDQSAQERLAEQYQERWHDSEEKEAFKEQKYQEAMLENMRLKEERAALKATIEVLTSRLNQEIL